MHGERAAEDLLRRWFLSLFGEERIAFESERESIGTDVEQHGVFQDGRERRTFAADVVEDRAKQPQIFVARSFSRRRRDRRDGRNVCGQTTCRWSSNGFGSLRRLLRRLRNDGRCSKWRDSGSSGKRWRCSTFGRHSPHGWSASATSRRWTSVGRCSGSTTAASSSASTLKKASFERRDAVEQLVDGQEGRASSEAYEGHFEGGTRLSTAHDVIERPGKTLMQSRQIVGIGAFGEGQDIDGFAVGEVEQTGGIFGDFGHHEIAQVRQEIPGDMGQVVTLLGKVVNDAQARVSIAIDERGGE